MTNEEEIIRQVEAIQNLMNEIEITVKEALSKAVEVLYFDDNSDYMLALWKIVRLLGGDEAADLLMDDGHAAYVKYCRDGEEEDE